jgi:hypothetical protein
MNFAAYTQFQYYHDELTSWSQSIEFQKNQITSALSRLGLLSDMESRIALDAKDQNAFIDQLLVQEQQFDFIANLITSQRHRMEKIFALGSAAGDASISNHQEILRSKMKSNERNFLNTRYNCSMYISDLLNEDIVDTVGNI